MFDKIKILKKVKKVTDLPRKALIMYAGTLTHILLNEKKLSLEEVDELITESKKFLEEKEAQGITTRKV